MHVSDAPQSWGMVTTIDQSSTDIDRVRSDVDYLTTMRDKFRIGRYGDDAGNFGVACHLLKYAKVRLSSLLNFD
tara:strand:- start:1213 stop:1434 length:222 start_codon:yes stop_codon:yes gene_type:complete